MMALVEAGKLDQLNLNELLFVAESIAQDTLPRTSYWLMLPRSITTPALTTTWVSFLRRKAARLML